MKTVRIGMLGSGFVADFYMQGLGDVNGQEVVLNESLNVVLARGTEVGGEVVTFKDLLEDGRRAMVVGRADEERVCELGDSLIGVKIRAGDHVLKHLASVIKTRIRREDVLARYGGEEFAIVLPEIDHYNAMQFAEKIRKLVEAAEFKFEDAVIPVTVSIGVASLRGEIEDALEFIKQADTNLFAAKEGGRNRVVG